MKKILFILGTRPEAIKLAPIILELKKHIDRFTVVVCNTEQQKELSNQTLSFFGINADIQLDSMAPNQSLPSLQSVLMQRLEEVYAHDAYDATFVQGDTMTVLCGAQASFYNRVPVFHVEAGLRSYNLDEPFPEEAIRQMTSRIATFNYCPTQAAAEALLKEGISSSRVLVTGNTVVDALFCLSSEILQDAKKSLRKSQIILEAPLVLVTVHRRENHGERLLQVTGAIQTLASKYPLHQYVLPVHPNPNVKRVVEEHLSCIKNVHLIPPQDYPNLVCLMKNAHLVLTDSGGIQEEAPSFGVPVLVMRHETERMEGVHAGVAKLVGTDQKKIVNEATSVLDAPLTLHQDNKNPYGSGQAAKCILAHMDQMFFG